MPTGKLRIFLIAAILASPIPAEARLLGGAGREAIAIPPSTLPLDGFTRLRDPLQARVVLLDDGKARAAIAVIDQTSIFEDLVSSLQTIIRRETATDPGNVLVIASHTFSAPHAFAPDHLPPGMAMPPDDQKRAAAYQAAVIEAARKAAAEAAGSLTPVRALVSLGTSRVNVNRNRLSAQGWWLGADEGGYADGSVEVLSLEANDHRPVATLVNYAVQSSVMDHSIGTDGGKGVTADLAGATVRQIEALRPGTVALFLTGAAGDQMPAYTARRNVYDAAGNYRTVDIGDLGYSLADLQGERLGDAVLATSPRLARDGANETLRVTRGSVSLDAQERPKDLQQIKPSRTYHYVTGGKVQAPFVVVTIGDVAIVGVQAELSAITGATIRAHSPFSHTMVVTMVNGAAKYMPDAAAYRDITYEAMNSSFAPGSADIFAAGIERALAAMHGAQKR
jgi:hypothetical protein